MPDQTRTSPHTISLNALKSEYGLTQTQAHEFIAIRKKLGEGFSHEDVKAIAGVSPGTIARLDPLFGGNGVQQASFRFDVRVKNAASDLPLSGLSVLAYATPSAAGSAPHQKAFVPDEHGLCCVELPFGADAVARVTLTVKGPTGDKLIEQTFEPAALKAKETLLTVSWEPIKLPAPSTPVRPKPTMISGRVLDKYGATAMDEKQFILYVATDLNPGGDDYVPYLAGTTESKGYFYIAYPKERFTGAYIVVGIDTQNRVPVKLENVDEAGFGDMPERLIVVVEGAGLADKSGCDSGCTDLGFYDSKRILDEFTFHAIVRTTEPAQVKSMELDSDDEVELASTFGAFPVIADLLKAQPLPVTLMRKQGAITDSNANPMSALEGIKVPRSALKKFLSSNNNITAESIGQFALQASVGSLIKQVAPGRKLLPGRNPLTAANPIDWDDDPTIYQAASIAHGHYLTYRQEWLADGYSIGDLLYSLPLAPGQKKQVVVLDWERRESATNRQTLSYEDALHNSLSRDRDINEIAQGSLRESMHGESEADSFGVGGGLGAAGSGTIGILSLGASLGFGIGYGSASSSASQKNSRNVSASNMQTVRDRLVQSASSVRSQRSTVIQTVSQGERFSATSETVANYNHCHAITIEYFEVLRHFKVQQRLTDVQECLFVPLMMSLFDEDKALRWRGTLRKRMLDRSLVKAFDSLERVHNNWLHSDIPTVAYADENIVSLSGELKIEFRIRRPKDVYDEDAKEWTFDPTAWGPLMNFFGVDIDKDKYDDYFKKQKDKDAAFDKLYGQTIVERFMEQMSFYALDAAGTKIPLNVDATLVSRYKKDTPLSVSLRVGGTGFPKRRQIEYFGISKDLTVAKYGASYFGDLFPSGTQILVRSGSLTYRTKHHSGQIFNQNSINNDLTYGDNVLIYAAPTQGELRNPREDDQEAAKKLLRHLNENLEFYHRLLWLNMSPERRFMLLDGIIAPNTAGGRSVASVVENRVIGIVGNCLVMPVVKGLHLDPSMKQHMIDERTGEVVSLLDHYECVPPEPAHIAVPTRGVFAEAVMGRCNSCEVKEEHRFWRWEESPIPDDPTPFNTISSDSRRADPGNLQSKDFPQTILNIQNAPSAPDPTGMSNVSQLLGMQSPFRDLTGLSENQKNSIKGMDTAISAAESFGKMAADLAAKQAALKGNDSFLQSLKRASEEKIITPEQMQEHANTYFKSLAGSAMSNSDTVAKPTLTDAAVKAVDQGKAVKAERVLAEGGRESIEVAGSSAENVLAKFPGTVPAMQQKNEQACWATAATMMMSWRKRAPLSVESVLAEAGDSYLQRFNQGEGLPANQKKAFLAALKLVGEAPANYPVQQYIEWVNTYGPLWLTTDSALLDGQFAPHARIVIRIAGSGAPTGENTNLVFIDPATGKEATEKFSDFIYGFEKMAQARSLFTQVVHFSDKVSAEEAGEGMSVGAGAWPFKKMGHEVVTVRALRDAGIAAPVPSAYGTKDFAINEVVRGCVWNDDPACLLFDDSGKDNNYNAGLVQGKKFLDKFNEAKKEAEASMPPSTVTGRSHFGDLQFLHAMGAVAGEAAHDTLAKVLMWAEFAYRVAIKEAGLEPSAKLDQVPVKSSVTVPNGPVYSYRVDKFFNSGFDPMTEKVADIFVRRVTGYTPDVPRRALGSLLHLVEDAYTKGHVRRRLTNAADLKTSSPDQDEFKSGTWGIYAGIENFHTYKGQDSAKHAKYDDRVGGGDLDVNNLDTFNTFLGARDALECATALVARWKVGLPYTQPLGSGKYASYSAKDILEKIVFALDSAVKPSDNSI